MLLHTRPQSCMIIIIINQEPIKLWLSPVVSSEDEGGGCLPIPAGVGHAGAQALVPPPRSILHTSKSGV